MNVENIPGVKPDSPLVTGEKTVQDVLMESTIAVKNPAFPAFNTAAPDSLFPLQPVTPESAPQNAPPPVDVTNKSGVFAP